MSLEKEFIPYEQTVALKELCFKEECFGGYTIYTDGDIKLSTHYNSYSQAQAPTFAQSFRFFREKYSMQATIEPTKDQHRFELGFNYWIWNTKTDEEWFTEPRDKPAGDYIFDTYEEAELACLKKLIELVKNK